MSSRSENDYFDLCFYLASLGVVLAIAGYRRIKKKTMMRNIATQVISAASAGVVELEGVAWPMKSIETSIQDEKIVFRYLKIEKLVKSGKSSKWVKVWEKFNLENFLLFDHSGMVIINPKSDTFEKMIEDLRFQKYNPHKFTEAQLEQFNRLYDGSVAGLEPCVGKSIFGPLFNAHFLVFEYNIPIGAPLLIHGHLEPSDDSNYVHLNTDLEIFRERAAKLLKNKTFMKSLFDKNNDGQVDMEELRKGFKSTLLGSQKNSEGNFFAVELKTDGRPTEKIYGEVSHHHNQHLSLTDCFQEQLLRSKPIILEWLLFTLGLSMIGAAVYFICTLLKIYK